MLKPQANPTRDLISLDGIWNFALASSLDIEAEKPWSKVIPSTLQVPVPASYNDIFVDKSIRDHVGWVFYQTKVAVPRGWTGSRRSFLRFDAATHRARVYVDDHFVTEHFGGYTPFEADISYRITAAKQFKLTVAISNELHWNTIPPGHVEILENGNKKQHYQHDFFNYAGLTRSVSLCSVPIIYIDDITIQTEVEDINGNLKVDVQTNQPIENSRYRMTVLNEDGARVCEGTGRTQEMVIESVRLWQPRMAYLYRLCAEILCEDGETVLDMYELEFGVRSVKIEGNRFLINGKPFYFTGFGKHEDTPIRGRGFDPAYMIHDFNLMAWTGANSFRTSHYPYAEEVLDYADRHGILVINETAAVGLNLGIIAGVFGFKSPPTFSQETCNTATQKAHAQAIRELIARDKNRPSVILWTLANEPASSEAGVREYMEPLVNLARQLDSTRPLCFTNMGHATVDKDLITDLFDVICLNRYYGWYTQTGDLDAAEKVLYRDLLGWEAKYGKPIIITEYGADSQAGLHAACDVPWSEEYQARLLEIFHRVFDKVESVVGEHVWNFADFQCTSTMFRVDGNKKGIFTRERRPKSSAQALKRRWEVGVQKIPQSIQNEKN